MPENKNTQKKTSNQTTKKTKPNSDLIGRQAKPVPNNQSPDLDIDVDSLFPDTVILSKQEDLLNTSELDRFTTISNNRSLQFGQIDNMFLDASVSAIANTIVENVCQTSDDGRLMWVESSDINISNFCNYVLKKIKVDKFLPKWTTCLVKYGDVYLRLLRESDIDNKLFSRSAMNDKYRAHASLHEDLNKEDLDESINLVLHKSDDDYIFHLEMIDDPSSIFELTQHDITMAYIEVPNDRQTLSTNDMLSNAGGFATTTLNQGGAFNYQVKTGDINLYKAEDFVHGCLDEGDGRFPETLDLLVDDGASSDTDIYRVKRGKSMFYDAYKIWREKSLLEAAMLLARLTKSSVFRLVKLETGNTDKTKSSQLLHQVKDMFEQKRSYQTNQTMENYNNPGPMENWIYFNVRNNVGAITVETVGGDYDPKSMTDLDWWNNKYYGSFGIPKQYFGWTDDSAGFNGGSALTVISSVFQKKVVFVQNALCQMITSVLELYCWQKGLKGYIGNFTVKMKTPLSQEEISARENFSNKLNEISSAMSLFTDVETKSRRLKILKALIGKLEYGSEVQSVIDEEIREVEEKEAIAREEEEKAREEAAEGGGDGDISEDDLGLDDLDDLDSGLSSSGGDDLNLDDLGDLPSASDTPTESFSSPKGSTSLFEDVEFLDESEDLPTPEELGEEKIDFSENN